MGARCSPNSSTTSSPARRSPGCTPTPRTSFARVAADLESRIAAALGELPVGTASLANAASRSRREVVDRRSGGRASPSVSAPTVNRCRRVAWRCSSTPRRVLVTPLVAVDHRPSGRGHRPLDEQRPSRRQLGPDGRPDLGDRRRHRPRAGSRRGLGGRPGARSRPSRRVRRVGSRGVDHRRRAPDRARCR